jgi:hypothetical protein
MMFCAVVGYRSTTAIDGDRWPGNHLSQPKRCSDQPATFGDRVIATSAFACGAFNCYCQLVLAVCSKRRAGGLIGLTSQQQQSRFSSDHSPVRGESRLAPD